MAWRMAILSGCSGKTRRRQKPSNMRRPLRRRRPCTRAVVPGASGGNFVRRDCVAARSALPATPAEIAPPMTRTRGPPLSPALSPAPAPVPLPRAARRRSHLSPVLGAATRRQPLLLLPLPLQGPLQGSPPHPPSPAGPHRDVIPVPAAAAPLPPPLHPHPLHQGPPAPAPVPAPVLVPAVAGVTIALAAMAAPDPAPGHVHAPVPAATRAPVAADGGPQAAGPGMDIITRVPQPGAGVMDSAAGAGAALVLGTGTGGAAAVPGPTAAAGVAAAGP